MTLIDSLIFELITRNYFLKMIFIDLLSNTVLLNLPFQRRASCGRSERFGVERGSSRAGQAVIEIDEVPPNPHLVLVETCRTSGAR